MPSIDDAIAKAATQIANEVNAKAILVVSDNERAYNLIQKYQPKTTVIAATSKNETFYKLSEKAQSILLFLKSPFRVDQIVYATALALSKGLVDIGDVIVGVLGELRSSDSIFVYKVGGKPLDLNICTFIQEMEKIKPEVLSTIFELAIEIGREGREGKPVGTAFVIGDSEKVLKNSYQLILNPFEGRTEYITDQMVRGTVKELSQLDGVFVLTRDGMVKAAGRYLDVDAASVKIPKGFGGRHAAAAAITKETGALAVTVSKSGGMIRVFKDGEIIMEIDPIAGMAFYTTRRIG
ncbi:MAG: diadenylate cyclase [Euryarchaeota archaeon]|nr:diadenylate cyclase [Euryarchaeota archaeon]